MPVFLIPINNVEQLPTIPVDKSIMLFGRHPECDVIIKTSRKVSRKHCCLAVVNNTLYLRDMGSMNGVRINGKRVPREAVIRVGDEIAIGDIEFQVSNQQAANQEKARPAVPTLTPPAPGIPSPSELSPTVPPPQKAVNLSQSFPVVIPENAAKPEDSFIVEVSSLNSAADKEDDDDLGFPLLDDMNGLDDMSGLMPDDDNDDIMMIPDDDDDVGDSDVEEEIEDAIVDEFEEFDDFGGASVFQVPD